MNGIQEVSGSIPLISTTTNKSEPCADWRWVRIFLFPRLNLRCVTWKGSDEMSTAKNELKKLYESIKQSNAQCEYLSKSIDFEKIINKFSEITGEECPDGIILIEDVVYMIEHFEISIYRDAKGNDLLRKMQNTPYQKLNRKSLVNPLIKPLNPKIDNLYKALSVSLAKHMKQYNAYVKRASEKYPGKKYKFVFVIEETGKAIINAINFNALDIYECDMAILSYPQIDGVILYHHGRTNDYLLALDRKALEERSNKVQRMDACELIISHIACQLTFDEKETIKKSLKDMGYLKDSANLFDEVLVNKHN